MFLNYQNTTQEKFFENNKIDNIQHWKDIDWIDNSILKSLKLTRKNSTQRISNNEWEQLKKVFIFNTEGTKIAHLREYAANQEMQLGKAGALVRGMISEKIIPLEKLEMKPGINLIEQSKRMNVPTYSSLYEYLVRGEHIGTCGFTSKLFGIYFHNEFKNTECHEGTLPLLKGTKKSSKGSHAWIETDYHEQRYLIDTSLLVAIPIELKEKVGYKDKTFSQSLTKMLSYLLTTRNSLTIEEDTLIECVNALSKDTVGKMSYRTYLSYKEKAKQDAFMER